MNRHHDRSKQLIKKGKKILNEIQVEVVFWKWAYEKIKFDVNESC